MLTKHDESNKSWDIVGLATARIWCSFAPKIVLVKSQSSSPHEVVGFSHALASQAGVRFLMANLPSFDQFCGLLLAGARASHGTLRAVYLSWATLHPQNHAWLSPRNSSSSGCLERKDNMLKRFQSPWCNITMKHVYKKSRIHLTPGVVRVTSTMLASLRPPKSARFAAGSPGKTALRCIKWRRVSSWILFRSAGIYQHATTLRNSWL